MDKSRHTVLAIDTSSSLLRVGIQYDIDRIVQYQEEVGRSHGEKLVPTIERLFLSIRKESEDLTAIVVCTGPGSFTGLRIGIAAAKGMAVVLNIPVVGISLFDIAAYKVRDHHMPTTVIVPLNRDQCGIALVHKGIIQANSIRIETYENLKDSVPDRPLIIAAGDQHAALTQLVIHPHASYLEFAADDLIALAIDKLHNGYQCDLPVLEPMYLQKSQAEILFEQRHSKKST